MEAETGTGFAFLELKGEHDEMDSFHEKIRDEIVGGREGTGWELIGQPIARL
jgi:hypothetical protein